MRFGADEYHGFDDIILTSLLRKGDKDAFTEVYRRNISQLYTLVFRYIKDPDAAQDILQQVFEKLWMIREAIRPEIQLRSYLYAMARNSVMNYIRNNRTALQNNYRIAQQRGEIEDDIYEKAEQQGVIGELMEAINKLPNQQKQVALYRCEGFSNTEIAKMMNLSLNTVNSHYMQCLKNLKRMLSAIVDAIVVFVFLNL